MNRFSVVVDGWSGLTAGQIANVSAIVVAGLQSDGFDPKIKGADGNFHAGIRWNMPVLKAKKPSDFTKVIRQANEANLAVVVFCREAQALSNSYEDYVQRVQTDPSMTIVSIAVYGEDEAVRQAVKFLSILG